MVSGWNCRLDAGAAFFGYFTYNEVQALQDINGGCILDYGSGVFNTDFCNLLNLFLFSKNIHVLYAFVSVEVMDVLFGGELRFKRGWQSW